MASTKEKQFIGDAMVLSFMGGPASAASKMNMQRLFRAKSKQPGRGNEMLAAGAVRSRKQVQQIVEAARNNERLVIRPQTPEIAEAIAKTLLLLNDSLLSERGETLHASFERKVQDILKSLPPQLSPAEIEMADRVAAARTTIAKEHGFFTREQLARKSTAKEPTGMVDTWTSRGKVFAVPLRSRLLNRGQTTPVFLAFQFDEGKPRPVIARVIKAFGRERAGWSLAHWFTSPNAWLADSARPVDLIARDPEAVVRAAQFDAMPAAA